jgi:aspartyl-tRNA(Asn)/glutamyl-tRNA(Gln) amidotransferase subunit C
MVSKDNVKHVANLAKLNLSDKEIDLMQIQLSKILDYIDLIKKVDTSQIKPTHHVHADSKNIFQSTSESDFDAETYFSHLKNVNGKFIVTKKVLDYDI